MLLPLAQVTIASSILFLLIIGVVGMLAPQRAWPFWSSFASTPLKNAIECVLRAAVGAAFFVDAASFVKPGWAQIAGGFLMVSALGMLLFYSAHQRYAAFVVPKLKPILRLYSGVAVLLGCGLIAVWNP